MKIDKAVKRFMCTPLKRYIPANALIGRYENAVRLVLQDAPQSDQDPFSTLVSGFVFDDPSKVTWFYGLEGNTSFFELVETIPEDEFGNVVAVATGSQFRLYQGIPYLSNLTTGKWNAMRVSGPDGNTTIEISQTGIDIGS